MTIKCYCTCTAWIRNLLGQLDVGRQKYLENFEIWIWRKTENIRWADMVRNEVVLKNKRRKTNFKYRKANWLGHMSRRNCLIWNINESKIKGRRRRKGKWKTTVIDDMKKGGWGEQKGRHSIKWCEAHVQVMCLWPV